MTIPKVGKVSDLRGKVVIGCIEETGNVMNQEAAAEVHGPKSDIPKSSNIINHPEDKS